MKLLVVLLVLAVVYAEKKYDSSYDNFDISDVLSNERLLLNYTRCLLDKGPCVPDVARFKEKLPEILETRCAKCTDKQKVLGKQMAKEMKRTHPKLWNELVEKYDPTGQYRKSFEQYLEEQH